jgi:hypothetical protein
MAKLDYKTKLAKAALNGAEEHLQDVCEKEGWLLERITDEPLMRQWRIRMADGMPRYFTTKFAEPL